MEIKEYEKGNIEHMKEFDAEKLQNMDIVLLQEGDDTPRYTIYIKTGRTDGKLVYVDTGMYTATRYLQGYGIPKCEYKVLQVLRPRYEGNTLRHMKEANGNAQYPPCLDSFYEIYRDTCKPVFQREMTWKEAAQKMLEYDHKYGYVCTVTKDDDGAIQIELGIKNRYGYTATLKPGQKWLEE